MPAFLDGAVASNFALSLALFLALLLVRSVSERLLAASGDPVAARQRRFTLRAVSNALFALALAGIWLAEIQNLMLSLAAVMVALVVATKELIMCVAGAVLRFGGNLFKVGDRIVAAGFRGEVVDHGLFSTTIMEMPAQGLGHAGTGRCVMLPNSLLLAGPIRIEPQPRQFAPHHFTITLDEPVPPSIAVARLEAAAEAALADDRDRAQRFHRMTAAKAGVDIAGPGCEVSLGTSELGKLQFHVMLYCLAQDARALQHRVTLAFLESVLVAGERPAATRTGEPGAPDVWPELARKLHEPRLRQNAA